MYIINTCYVNINKSILSVLFLYQYVIRSQLLKNINAGIFHHEFIIKICELNKLSKHPSKFNVVLVVIVMSYITQNYSLKVVTIV